MTLARRSMPVLWSASAALLLAGLIAVALFGRVEDLRDTAMAHGSPDWTPGGVAMQPVPGSTLQRIPLFAMNAAAVTRRSELDIVFTTFSAKVPVDSGTISIAGCLYTLAPHTQITHAGYARFTRSRGCETPPAGPVPMVLSMRVPGREPLVVTTVTPPRGPAGDQIVAGAPPDGAAARPIVVGRYVDLRIPSSVRRVYLLNHVWQLSRDSNWLIGILAAATLLFFVGALQSIAMYAGDGRNPIGAAAGVSCLALSLGLLYAVLIPPFHAPDEPDHFLEYANLTGRPDLSREAEDWARLGHFQRIRLQPGERFRPGDLDQPFPEAWDADVFPMTIGGRSPTTGTLWWGIGHMTAHTGAPGTLLAVRVVNAIVFALAAGAGAALIASSAGPAAAILIVVGLLLVPTLPFFATGMSESALLTSTYVVFGCVLAALLLDGPRTHRLGLPLGIALALMLAGGRSALPMVALAGAVMAGRVILGTRGAATRAEVTRQAAVFWLGAAAGALVLIPAAGEAYTRGLWPGDSFGVPGWLKSTTEALRARSWALVVILPVGLALEIAGWFVRRGAPGWIRGTTAAALRATAYTAAVAAISVAAASLVLNLPVVNPFTPATRPPLGPYLTSAISSFLTAGRLRGHDTLLSTFFWGGFGWLDTILPAFAVTILVGIAVALFIWLTIAVARHNDRRRSFWLVLGALGWILTVTLSTAASYLLHRNPHGRYLQGAYLAMLAVLWAAPAVAARSPARFRALPHAAIAACAAIHGFALAFIVCRYF
jgi:hypothetical protein